MKSSVAQFRPRREAPKPPAELQRAGQALWKAILAEFEIEDAAGFAHLLTACRSEDDVRRLRKQIATDGDLVQDRFGQSREHPLLAACRGAETTRRQALKSLNLDIEPLRDSKR